MSSVQAVVTDAQRGQFEEEGYFVLERVIPEEHLEMLREECGRLIELRDAEMERAGERVRGITQKGLRYFINAWGYSERVREFLFGELMAEVCRATLGDTAYLFNEQYVVKAAERGTKFSWHQDSGYIGHPHRPYLSCWCTLDDVTEENGTVYLLPYGRAGVREMVQHERDEASNDKVGYFGDDPGIPVVVPAGSVACFSSTLFHRSGSNTTPRARRIYLAQYSAEPIMSADGSKLWHLAEPLLRDGRRVA